MFKYKKEPIYDKNIRHHLEIPVWREITSSVLFGDVMVRNGIFWTIGEQSYIVYYPIISYRKIKVYRIETMDMRNVPMTPLFHWDLPISIVSIL